MKAQTAVALFLASTLPATAQQVEVIHWLTAGAESAAIQQLANSVEANGTEWIDLTAPGGGSDARAMFASKLAAGNPPGAQFLSIGPEARDLADQGILRDVTSYATEHHLIDAVPSFAIDLARGADGGLYALPIAFETQNFMWFSLPVYESAGLSPPTSWDEVIEQAPKLEEAGFIPLAVGEQGWQLTILFTGILAQEGGKDTYLAVMRDNDPEASSGAAVQRSFEIMRALSGFSNPGGTNRAWNETLNLVAEGKAAAQVMGSWSGAELSSMDIEYGTQWSCGLAGGNTAIIGATGFFFPTLPGDEAGQNAFIDAMMDPATQTAFSLEKGSIPARTDADVETLPGCSQIAAKAVAEGSGVPNVNAMVGPDAEGQIGDLLLNFWTNPGVSNEEGVRQFAQIIASVR